MGMGMEIPERLKQPPTSASHGGPDPFLLLAREEAQPARNNEGAR